MKKLTEMDLTEVGLINEGQLADLLGKSKDTLRYWRRKGYITPHGKVRHGKIVIYLYRQEMIPEYQTMAEAMKPGPKIKSYDEIEAEYNNG